MSVAETGMLGGEAGRMLGTESRDEVERDCLGGESEQSLPSSCSSNLR